MSEPVTREHGGGWSKPVTVIITMVALLIPQTIALAWFLLQLSATVETVRDRQIEHGDKLDKTVGKLITLNNVVQEGAVPTALISARISAVEAVVADLKMRVAENERKLLRADALMSASDARKRAEKER